LLDDYLTMITLENKFAIAESSTNAKACAKLAQQLLKCGRFRLQSTNDRRPLPAAALAADSWALIADGNVSLACGWLRRTCTNVLLTAAAITVNGKLKRGSVEESRHE
jgi:hypothetical protein